MVPGNRFQWMVWWLAMWFIVATGAPLCADEVPPRVPVRFSSDGRSYSLDVDGFDGLKCTWSASLRRGSLPPKILKSSDGELIQRGSTSVLRFADERLELWFELTPRTDAAAVMLRVGLRNLGREPVELAAATPVEAEWKFPANANGWFLTGFHPETPLVQAFRDSYQPAKVHEYGGCYHSSGRGFLFGPVGEPVAYVTGRMARFGEDRLYLSVAAEMNGVLVEPDELRWGQQVVLLAETPSKALPRWADWIAASHHARPACRPLTGWGSWYSYGSAVTGKDVLDQIETIRRHPDRLRPDVILIDEGHEQRAQFPEERAYYAKEIASVGARPGLKLALDRVEDPYEIIRGAVRDGFTYLKLGGIEPVGEAPEPKLTGFELNRKRYAAARDAAGPATYLLNCPRFLDRAAVGYVDASRTGRTTWRKHVVPAMNEVLRSYQLNGRWFAIDNDHYYLGTDLANVSEIVGGWPVVRTWMSMVGLSCGMAFTSDPLHLDSVKPFWRNFEAMKPPARETTVVPDLGLAWKWPRLVGHVRRSWGDFTVALLWNAEDKERRVRLDFGPAGMKSRWHYAVWSYWDNRYLGLTQEFWTSPSLAPNASQHLRFTPISSDSCPTLIGSNLHIYCGAAEIQSIQSSRSSMTIRLTDAGARMGDLFIYSRYQPLLRSVAGLTVANLDQAGENVWRLRLRDRRHDQAQWIELSIQLPVTQQWWFWSMIAAMIASIIVAIWRYVAWLKLQREHSLSEERTRIARDLHDDLGANLAEIAMISDLAQEQLPEDDPSRQSLNEIFSRAESNARRLGEIVWAINPENDTLERFVGFLCKFAQDYLALAKVGCRLDVPEQLPPLPLNSVRRHHLFLCAKEAIHNAVRHGRPTEVHLRIALHGRQLVLSIHDNGCGFTDTTGGTGLRGTRHMRDRMKRVGGVFRCESTPGSGTTVTFSTPLDS